MGAQVRAHLIQIDVKARLSVFRGFHFVFKISFCLKKVWLVLKGQHLLIMDYFLIFILCSYQGQDF